MESETTILHVDMDAFFASVELLDHPEWRGKPVIVGSGPHERGVVSTCSYEARRFGVHSAMPSRTAYEKCPHAIFTRPHMARYQEISERVFEIFSHYSPYVEGVSIDEAFLDITGSVHLHGNAERLGDALRREVHETCGVTCSVGIAPNRLLAKIGSELHKPNGLTMMPFEPNAIATFLAPRPLSILWGVGKKTEALLRPYGIATCGQVQRMPIEQLTSLLGESAAHSLWNYARGISDNHVYWEPAEEQSVSREHTFDEDVHDRAVVRAKLLELINEVGRRFRREARWAKTIRIKLRDTAFNTVTRQLSLEHPARDDQTWRTAALELFDREFPPARSSSVRLIGFGVCNLQTTPDDGEPSLFAAPDDQQREQRERLSAALDSLHERGYRLSR